MYQIPSPFTIRTVRNFLKEFEAIFKQEGSKIPNVLLVANNPEFDLLGALVFYKTIEFIIKKNCLYKPSLKGYKDCIYEMHKFGFGGLISPYFDSNSSVLFTPKYQEYDGVFIAPFVLKDAMCNQEEHQYAPNIAKFYNNSTITYAIFQCLAEIRSNFAEHAMDDTDTVMVASGNKKFFKIVCADTGVGVISSLSPSLNADRPLLPEDILMLATHEGITSKKNTNHMGYGLWLVNKFVESQKGELHIYSEGAFYMNRSGKIKKGKCGFWQGTIIYVSLPLQNLKGFKSIMDEMATKYDDIKINQV